MLTTSILTSFTLFAPGFVASSTTPNPASEPIPAMVSDASLTISDVDVTVTNLGGGQLESELTATGTITVSGISISTQITLDCEADTGDQFLQCEGGIGLGTSEAPIGLQYLDGQAKYAIDLDFVQTHSKAWELWYTQLLIDGVPPVDEDGNDISNGFVWVLWHFVDGEVFRVLFLESDWLWIIDGIILNPPQW